MPYVYILSDYNEYGAENVTATLDRAKLETVMRKSWPDAGFPYGGLNEWLAEAAAKMAELLQKSDAELASVDGHNLHRGWGGMQLHVVELK